MLLKKEFQIPQNGDTAYAVVTGASQGLGRAFAEELARNNINMILTSLPGQELSSLSTELSSQYNVQVLCYETDLSVNENVIDFATWINNSFSVFMLINNAGTGGSRKFEEATPDYINTIIQVNVMATSLLTHQLLLNLKKQEKSYILNVSSMAAFCPIGYKTVYPASKAFVHSFSRGLYEELKHTNVFVSVVNPGAMKTSEEITRRIEKQGFLGKLTLLDPDAVARYSIKQLLKRDTVIMVNRMSWLMLNMLPIWIKLPLLTRTIKRELNVGL